MASFLFIVRSQPHKGQDVEFNRWYREQHVPDLLRVPGIKSARRFEVVSQEEGWKGTYLGVYEVEADDIAMVTEEIKRRRGTDAMPKNPTAVDSSQTFAIWARPIDPPQTATDKGISGDD